MLENCGVVGTKTRTDTLRIACMDDTASHATDVVIV